MADKMVDLRILKIVTIVAPATFIGLFEFLRHRVSTGSQAMEIGNLLAFLVALFGAFVFSRVIFGIMERMQRENARKNQELTVLNSVALAVSETLNLDVILYRSLDKVLELTNSDAGEIFLLDERTGEMVQRVHTGLFPEAFREITRFQPDQGFVGIVAASGEPIVAEDIAEDERLAREELRQRGFKNMVCVPLKAKNVVIGVITLASLSRREFAWQDMELLDNVGNRIAVAVENARLHERVQDLAALEERERIAREMHDSLAQYVSYVIMKSQATRQVLQKGQTQQAMAAMEELETTAQDAYADVREAILGLRSTDTLRKGMAATIREYVLHFGQANNIKTDLQFDGQVAASLPNSTEIQVIRIVQEALANVRKHAHASQVWVRASIDDDKAVISIRDNGEGFRASSLKRGAWPKFGLQTMRERAESVMATLEIDSTLGEGTEVVLKVPLRDSLAERLGT